MQKLHPVFEDSSVKEIWENLAKNLGARFRDGGIFEHHEILLESGSWQIILDTYEVFKKDSMESTIYTRMRAPFINRDDFYFKIYNEDFFSPVRKILGLQDIIVGNKLFDDLYMIQSNDEEKTKALLSSPKIQKLIHSIDKIDLEILDSEGIFKENYPENVDTVYFQCANRIDNIKKLKDLFNLFSEILKRLVHLGSAYESDPNLII